MEYDYIKIKSYECREISDGGNSSFVLSFSEKQHIKVNEKAKYIFGFFNGIHSLSEINDLLNENDIDCSIEELKIFVDKYIISNSIAEGTGDKPEGKSHLWFRIPVIDSRKLEGISKRLAFLFSKKVTYCMLLGIVGCSLWNLYILFQLASKNLQVNSIGMIIFLYLTLFWHELGHITAAHNCKVKTGYLGIGMYLCTFVFYSDLTNIWRLDKKSRMIIDLAGVYFQMILIIPLTIEAIIINSTFLYCLNLTIILSALYNLIPLFRLDGFWLFCDYFELNNMTTKSFYIVKSYFKKEEKVLMQNKKSYLYSAFINVISTIVMLIMGVCFTVKIFTNWDYYILQLQRIYRLFSAGSLNDGFVELNNIFIYLVPFIYIIVVFIQALCALIRRLFQKKHS